MSAVDTTVRDVLAEIPALPVRDGRLNNARKPERRGPRKGGPESVAHACHALLREALLRANAAGQTRAGVAVALGVSERTVENWLIPSRVVMIPAHQFVALLLDDVLPEAVREWLWATLGHLDGRIVVDVERVRGSNAALTMQTCELTAAMGVVAASIAQACHPMSSGGTNLTDEERAGVLANVGRLANLAEQVRASVKAGGSVKGRMAKSEGPGGGGGGHG